MTFALVSMMRPDRSAVTVTGTEDAKVPAKIAEVTTMNTTVAAHSISAHQPG